MGDRYQAYPEYKDSGVEWLGDVPKHWNVKKLKFLANIHPSNVDKKTKNGEQPVFLCNYTDVYYNDTVNSSMSFMKATATQEQIDKFTLRSADIIITKDSEDPNDIAIPTFVTENMEGVVCGYHLSIIRTDIISYGAYIKRVFESGFARAYFATKANGLTRYGLGTYSLENVFYPEPPKIEAVAIAKFLDHETAKIDILIEKQQHLIQLLKEKRQAVISHAVTKGLNPDVPMKDTDVDWLGRVPAHWNIKALKYMVSNPIIDGPHETPNKFDEGIPFISAEAIHNGCINFDKIWGFISEEEHKRFSKRFFPKKNDIFVVKVGATTGKIAMVTTTDVFNIWVPLAAVRIKKPIVPKFVYYQLRSSSIQDAIQMNWTYGTQQTLGLKTLENFRLPIPQIQEQHEVVSYLDDIIPTLENLISKANDFIALLQERRTALISAAVTGKINVLNWQSPEKSGQTSKAQIKTNKETSL
ncbi:MAG: restriction endonuclease subunit S [Desulfobacteraceae bacterium]|nr:restriction endonuclease subunit S [Desulfobacteraceae bacterium]